MRVSLGRRRWADGVRPTGCPQGQKPTACGRGRWADGVRPMAGRYASGSRWTESGLNAGVQTAQYSHSAEADGLR